MLENKIRKIVIQEVQGFMMPFYIVQAMVLVNLANKNILDIDEFIKESRSLAADHSEDTDIDSVVSSGLIAIVEIIESWRNNDGNTRSKI